ncbi:MAG: cytochrome P450 [Anaerolineaceae bacterium]|nr:cytochrome P450 [Anaerolineaceae bacterium]
MTNHYPPGPDTNFVQAIRSTLRQQHDRLGFLIDMAQTYGDTVHFHTGLRHIYFLNHPDDIHTVFVEQADKFYKTRPVKQAFGKFMGQGLLASDGELHRRERRLAQPAFHHKRIEAYAEIMVEHTLRVMNQWCEGQVYAIDQEMMNITLGIVAQTLFNAEVAGDAETVGHSMTILQDGVIRYFRSLIHLPDWLPTPQNRREQQALAALDQIIAKIIHQRLATGEDKGDLLSMLLLAIDDDGSGMSIQQVRDEVISLFVAGHETTANTLTWTWYLLGQHPDAWAQLLTEVTTVLGGRNPTLQDVAQLPYTAMVIREALRLYPPVWVITREAIAPVEVAGYRLEQGNVVVTSPYVMHRDPRYFNDPEQFRPERFTDGWEKDIPRFAYFPFGGGPRICVGQSFALMEATLILATIVQRYQIELIPEQKVALDPLVTLRAKQGIQVTIKARH